MSDTVTRRGGRPRRTAIILVALAVACVAIGITAILAGTNGGGAPPPRPGPAAAGQLPGDTASHMPGHGPDRMANQTPDQMAMPAPSVPGPGTGSGSPGSAAPTGTTPPANGSALPASRPTALDIPAIGVHGQLLDLGLNADGTVQVPGKPLRAGWFHGSPAPGQAGPAVILGHVDSYTTGPAVFYRLGAMKPHDRISVTRADHKVAVFTVDAVRSYAKKAFPTLDVYGNTPDPELRLITCSDWDEHAHSYQGNTVVYAHLVR